MGIGYPITIHPAVIKDDIPRLDPEWRHKIRDAIRAKLSVAPDLYGFPLHQTLKGHRKLRVGDYRVIYRVQKNTVHIVKIGHRSTIYKNIQRDPKKDQFQIEKGRDIVMSRPLVLLSHPRAILFGLSTTTTLTPTIPFFAPVMAVSFAIISSFFLGQFAALFSY